MKCNEAVLVGRITKPLELKEVTTNGGKKTVGNMTICAVKKSKQPDGSFIDVPTFYEVSTWNKVQQDELSKLRAGECVLVQGELEAKQYEHNSDVGINLSVTNATVTPLGNQNAGVQTIVAVGRATQDVTVAQTANGQKVARIPLALNHGGDRTSFVEVEVWGAYAETIAKSVNKGSLLTVSGELDVNTYGNRKGGNSSKLRIVNAQVGFMDKAAKATGAGASGQNAGNAGKPNSSSGR